MPVPFELPPDTPLADVATSNTPTKWTVMVFMGADVEQGNAPMLGPALEDLAEMAAVGSGRALDIFVQLHTRHEIRRGRVTRETGLDAFLKGDLSVLDLYTPEQAGITDDAPSGEALLNFVLSSLDLAKHNADDQRHCSMLVLWGHAYNFAMGHSPLRNNSVDAFDFVEIGKALEVLQHKAQEKLKAKRPPKLDVIAFDACDIATAEVAYELSPFADYLLSSQVGVPIPGWPYGDVLKRLSVPHGKLMSPVELGHWIVSRYCESYVQHRTVSLSMLDLTRAGSLCDRVAALTTELQRFIEEDATGRDLVAEVLANAITEVDKPFVDIADVCLGLLRECGDKGVNAAARALGDFITAPPVNLQAAEPVDDGGNVPRYPFVTAYGRNAAETARLNGVSLYAPHVSPDDDHEAVKEIYDRFRFVALTGWDQLVERLIDNNDQ